MYTSLEDFFIKKDENISESSEVNQDESELFQGNQARDNYFTSYRTSSRRNIKRITPFIEYINTCKDKGILPVPHGFAQK